jgi:hypothetical protein
MQECRVCRVAQECRVCRVAQTGIGGVMWSVEGGGGGGWTAQALRGARTCSGNPWVGIGRVESQQQQNQHKLVGVRHAPCATAAR